MPFTVQVFIFNVDIFIRSYFFCGIVDSPASAEREIKVFFPDFKITEWYEKEEPLFRKGQIEFVEDLFIHRIHNTGSSSKR